jgi:hypothetical protein
MSTQLIDCWWSTNQRQQGLTKPKSAQKKGIGIMCIVINQQNTPIDGKGE